MKMSPRITFFGSCRDAVEYYKDVFQTDQVDIITFTEAPELANMEQTDDTKKLIYRAELTVGEGDSSFSFIMGDSPALIFNSSQVNASGNQDNITYEITSREPNEISALYEKLIEEGKANITLRKTDALALYASLIDKYGICWNLRCVNK